MRTQTAAPAQAAVSHCPDISRTLRNIQVLLRPITARAGRPGRGEVPVFDDPISDDGSAPDAPEGFGPPGGDEYGDAPFAAQVLGDPVFGDRPAGTTPLAAVHGQFARRLPEMAFEPGLVAAVDQHAAAIRDAVQGHPSMREALTDYVLGFTDALREIGWSAHEGYDFATLRLTAVCHFMREYGVGTA